MTSQFLGIPKDENEWLLYETTVTIFAGTNKLNDEDYWDEIEYSTYWEMEAIDITKNKLIKGLEKVGVRCESFIVINENTRDGTRLCKCICSYNKPYEVYHSEFFLEGIGFDDESTTLEFCFEKRL